MEAADVVATIWTVIAIRYAMLSCHRLWVVKKDRTLLHASGKNGLLRMAANANVRRAQVAFLSSAAATVAGAMAFVFDPGLVTRSTSAVVLVAMLAAQAWSLDQDIRDRYAMMMYEELSREHNADHHA